MTPRDALAAAFGLPAAEAARWPDATLPALPPKETA